MSYPHKDFIQSEIKSTLRKNWVQVQPGIWKRISAEEEGRGIHIAPKAIKENKLKRFLKSLFF